MTSTVLINRYQTEPALRINSLDSFMRITLGLPVVNDNPGLKPGTFLESCSRRLTLLTKLLLLVALKPPQRLVRISQTRPSIPNEPRLAGPGQVTSALQKSIGINVTIMLVLYTALAMIQLLILQSGVQPEWAGANRHGFEENELRVRVERLLVDSLAMVVQVVIAASNPHPVLWPNPVVLAVWTLFTV